MFHCSNNWWQAASRRIFSRLEVLESPSLCIEASNVDIGMGNVKPTRCNNCDVPSWMDWSGFITYLSFNVVVQQLFNGNIKKMDVRICSYECSIVIKVTKVTKVTKVVTEQCQHQCQQAEQQRVCITYRTTLFMRTIISSLCLMFNKIGPEVFKSSICRWYIASAPSPYLAI